jgi:enamine deaminase RidA (YjgF/YER057c/UK114 family)
MLSGTIEQETAGTIESIRRILAEEGATLADVVQVTTYLGDTRDFGRYNKVFSEHFQEAVLARTTVEARAVINTKIEMAAIAYKPK